MKRRSLLALACAMLVCIMMLSSCAAFGNVAFKKVFDASLYEDTDPAYARADVIVGLADMDVVSNTNQLVLLSKTNEVSGYTGMKYVVYNLDTNYVVYEGTTSKTNDLEVVISDIEDSAVFTVINKTWRLDSNNAKLGRDYVSTALYDASGTKLAETYRRVDVQVAMDLVQFDGKCYRLENGAVAYAFDYSDLKQLPDIVAATDKYYFVYNDNGLSVYTKELELKSTSYLPTYAEINTVLSLDDKKILVQYTVEEEENAKKYDYIAEKTVTVTGADDATYEVEKLQKYSLYTVVLNGSTGKLKDVKLNYLIAYGTSEAMGGNAEEWHKYWGINEKCTNVAVLYPIEGGRVNDSEYSIVWGTFNSKGKLSTLANINGLPLGELPWLVAADRWVIEDAEGREMLLDEKGKAIGEVSNASYRDAYMYAEGKMYDYNLNVIYDYAKDNLVIERTLDECVLFKNIDNELICYSASGSNIVIQKEAKRSLFLVESDYFIIADYNTTGKVIFELYNAKGNKITTISADAAVAAGEASEVFGVVCTNDATKLVKVLVGVTAEGTPKYEFYRLGA